MGPDPELVSTLVFYGSILLGKTAIMSMLTIRARMASKVSVEASQLSDRRPLRVLACDRKSIN